jgi:hypothetical protein
MILTPLLVLVVGAVLYFVFRDFPEQRKAKRFVELLQQKDYKSAYALWGCTDANPCPQYAFDKFLEDWGPTVRSRMSIRPASPIFMAARLA